MLGGHCIRRRSVLRVCVHGGVIFLSMCMLGSIAFGDVVFCARACCVCVCILT
jgi:hypothetical protein